MKLSLPAQHILDFDIECRPLSWYGGDFVTRDITAIGWRWSHQKRAHAVVLGSLEDPIVDQRAMLEIFLNEYAEADIVTGHFIRGFDLPVLNAALVEHGMHPLEAKMTSDTKLDLVKRSGASNSQENLAAELGVKAPKIQMTQADWREANRLTPKGRQLTMRRVMGDVNQHLEMRERMLELGLLTPPKLWSPEGKGFGKYHA